VKFFHVPNFYDQIFMEDSCATVPDLPTGVKRSSVDLVRSRINSALGGSDDPIQVSIVIREDLDDIVAAGTGRGRFQFERQLLSDIAVATGVKKNRLSIEHLGPQEGMERHTFVVLQIVHDRDNTSAPSCRRIAIEFIDAVNSGVLNGMPSLRKAIRAELDKRGATKDLAVNQTQTAENQLKFSFLRGGIFEDSSNFSGLPSVQVVEDVNCASYGALGSDIGLNHEHLRRTLAEHERGVASARRLLQERRSS
jgi:hypothetical protein